MRIALISHGCKVNRAEIEALIARLPAFDAEYASDFESADVIIVNTCAVTGKAQRDGERYLRQLKMKYHNAKIVATGCLAELLKEQTLADVIVPNADKENILKHITNSEYQEDKPIRHAVHTHTRAFLKIQDGCDAYCTYCIIPSLRGAPHSKPIANVLHEIKEFLDNGYKEIVLTGIHIGLYGADRSDNIKLCDLLQKICEINGDFRVRLTSLYVNEINPELIDVIKNSGGIITPHFHISLQSGSAEILQKMGRKYAPDDFISTVDMIRSNIADVNIGADLIVGFPSESESLFNESVELLQKVHLDYMHIFPFSPRPGTPAADMPEQISESAKQARANMVRNIADKYKLESMQQMNGKIVRVLSEAGNKGHTDNFHLVHLLATTPKNIFIQVKLKFEHGKLFAKSDQYEII